MSQEKQKAPDFSPPNKVIVQDQYEFTDPKRLGAGLFGVTYRYHCPELHQYCAIKFQLQPLADTEIQEKSFNKWSAEASFWKKIHPGQYVEAIKANQDQPRHQLILPYLGKHTLFEKLTKHDTINTTHKLFLYMKLITKAVMHFHEETKSVHMDVKLDNFIVSEKKQSAHLIDFGSACNVNQSLVGVYCPSPHIAPERVGPYQTSYSHDVFSLGHCFEVLAAYSKKAISDTERQLIKQDLLFDVASELDGLISKMKNMFPFNRPSLASVLSTLDEIDQKQKAYRPLQTALINGIEKARNIAQHPLAKRRITALRDLLKAPLSLEKVIDTIKELIFLCHNPKDTTRDVLTCSDNQFALTLKLECRELLDTRLKEIQAVFTEEPSFTYFGNKIASYADYLNALELEQLESHNSHSFFQPRNRNRNITCDDLYALLPPL